VFHMNHSAISQRHSQLVLLQPTPFCNINCNYCYLPERHNKKLLSLETANLIFRQCFESDFIRSPFTFLWHSGEPLAIPPEYFEQLLNSAKQIASEYDKEFNHCVQTNATLINSKWISLLQAYNVGISVSIDGPEFIHDRNRITRTGLGTHASAMRGLSTLKMAGLPFHAIAVLTSFSLDYPDEIFNFFVDNAITSVGFNIDEIEGAHKSSSFATVDAKKRYSEFIMRFLELNEESNGILRVREFESVLHTLFAPSYGSFADTTNQPLEIISFDADGNFATYSPELLGCTLERHGTYHMGNVHNEGLSQLPHNRLFLDVTSEINAGLVACKDSCDYWGFCGGGPPVNKYFEHRRFDVTETLFCSIHKKVLVDTILDFIEHRLDLK
jgi:uncharacterized protein